MEVEPGTRALRVTVDHGSCVGNGQCVDVAPAVFRHNDDVQSEVVDPAGTPEHVVLRAARLCPVSAILVEDATSGEVLFP